MHVALELVWWKRWFESELKEERELQARLDLPDPVTRS